MHNLTSAEIVLIITTIFTGIVSVIGAIKGNTSNKRLEKQDEKLDVIHSAANGNLAKALEKIDALAEENRKLREQNQAFNRRKHTP